MNDLETFFTKSSTVYNGAEISHLMKTAERHSELSYWKSYKTKYANELKEELLMRLSAAIEYNSMADYKKIRQLRDEAIVEKNIISVFESTLTRTLGLETNELTTDFMVIKVYYFDIIKDLILNGFEYNGEKYMFLTASAGQIRTKKTVFIKESLWKKHENSLMCGLSVDKINQQGGINVNKYLAYLALSNSATDLWEDFDIDRCIVVPDFETNVHGTVDFIDDKTYRVLRQEMNIGIEHTDGAGMMLPCVSKKNFMVRLPWIKGLLGVMDFRKFIETHQCSPVIADIYGQEHNIIDENIQIIFTKSQFKTCKYYRDWNEYKEFYKKYKCQAGRCKIEEDYIKPANISYQMLQTLTDITDSEFIKIATPAVDKLNNVTNNLSMMLDLFGAVKENNHKSAFQEALLIYPELLNDAYCKRKLNDIRNSLVKQYRSGKLPVRGKYTFVLPDLYAFCERLFLHIEEPVGLLDDGQVTCRLYKTAKKLDCLRSPHLYREHAVRENIMNDKIQEWFQTDAIYTSCRDMISKVLQFDCDGDTLLVIADRTIIEISERNMEGIVPLFYDMKKAEPVILTNEEFYKGMTAAWTGGNIGEISNDITKIWNSSNNISESELLAIKLLCCENNFVIDYAKTLYKPTRPDWADELIRKYTKSKMPYFFMDAKGYSQNQVEKINDSLVNRLRKIIKKKRLNFKRFGWFDYRKMMTNPYDGLYDDDLIETYELLNKQYRHRINNDDGRNSTNIQYIKASIIEELSQFGYSNAEIADILVEHLYSSDSEAKMLLWLCYGDLLVENLKKHINPREIYCRKCGTRFVPKKPGIRYCDSCHKEKNKKKKIRRFVCIDCGKIVEAPSSASTKKRCDVCQEKAKKELTRRRVEKFRLKQKSSKSEAS